MSLSGIYDDLESFEAQQQNIELIKTQHELKDKVEKLENEVLSLRERVNVLEKENATLARNISRLFMTAKKEIRQKEARIGELTNSIPFTVQKVHCGIQTNLSEDKQTEIIKNIPREEKKKNQTRYERKSRSRDRKSSHSYRKSRRKSQSRSHAYFSHKRKRSKSRSHSRSDSRKKSKCKELNLMNPTSEIYVNEYLTVDGISLGDEEFVNYCDRIFADECTDVKQTSSKESQKDEVPKETTEVIEKVSEENFDNIPEEVLEKSPDKTIKVLEKASEEIIKDTSEKVIEVFESINEEDPKNLEKASEKVVKNIPEEINEKVPDIIDLNENIIESVNKDDQNLIETNTIVPVEQLLEVVAYSKSDIVKNNEDHNLSKESEKLPVISTQSTNTINEINDKIDKLFTLMGNLITNQQQLQQQVSENKDILTNMAQTKTTLEKISLKFNEHSSNDFIVNESKREIVLLKPTIVKLQPINESEITNDQRISQQCPDTPPLTQNLNNRFTAVVSTPKKKSKTIPLLNKQISAEIKNLMPNRYENNTFSSNTTISSEFKSISKNEKINILIPRKWKRTVTNTSSNIVKKTVINQEPPTFVQNNNEHMFNESSKMFNFCSPEKTITLSQLISKSPSMQVATAQSQTILEEKCVNKNNASQNIEAIIKSIEKNDEQQQDFTLNSLFDVLTKITKTPQPETDNNGDMDRMIVDHIAMDKEESFSSLIDVMENSKLDVCQYYEEKMRKAEEDAVINDNQVKNFDMILINDKTKNMPEILDCEVNKNQSLISNMPLIVDNKLIQNASEVLNNDHDDDDDKNKLNDITEKVQEMKRVTRRSIIPMKPRNLSVNLDETIDDEDIRNLTKNNKKITKKEKSTNRVVNTIVKDPNMEKLKRIRKKFGLKN